MLPNRELTRSENVRLFWSAIFTAKAALQVLSFKSRVIFVRGKILLRKILGRYVLRYLRYTFAEIARCSK